MKNLRKDILRFTVIASGLFVVGLSLFLAGQTVPFKITSLLREGHPVRVEYEAYEKNYDDERFVWLLLEQDSPYTEREIEKLGRLVRVFYDGFRGVQSVEGLENAEYISFKNDYFRLRPFMVNKELTPEGKTALKDEFWKKTLINETGNALLFGISLTKDVTGLLEKDVMKNLVESKSQWEEKFPNLKAHFIGTKVGKYYFLREMTKNQMTVTPLLFLFLGVLIWFLFRTWKIVFWFFFIMFLAYSSILMSIILMEGGLNPYSGFALFFVLIVATSDLVHFFSIYLKSSKPSIEDRIKETIDLIYMPCLLTTITTSVGFLSLMFNEMAPVFYFGIYCALGSILCFVLTFYFLPFVLKLFKVDFVLTRSIPKFKLDQFIEYVQLKPKRVIAVTLLLFVTLGAASTRLTIDDDFYGKFKKDHELSQSIDAFGRHFNFIGSVDVMISSREGDILDQSNNGRLSEIEKRFTEIEGVSYSRSFQKIMDYIERALKKGILGEEPPERIRERKESIFHLLNDYKIFDLSYIESLNEVRTTLFMDTTSSGQLDHVLKRIEEIGSEYPSLTVKTMGFSSIRTFLMGSIIENFLKSFLFSFIIIFFIFLGIFRKFQWACLAMIPNLLPLIFISGAMGIFGFKVESNLVLLICISLGIAVDDTIHFLWAMKRAQGKGQTQKNSIKTAFNETSNALLGTTMVFVLSFPTFFLAELKLFQQMGLFIMLALLIALLADFIVLPALFTVLNRNTRVEQSE